MLPAHAANDLHWREWMRQLGARVRQLRELVGLSQDELARSVGVSQGAVSRLEHGRGPNTPLLVALKVYGGLVAALESVEPAALSDDARALVVQLQALSLPEDGASGDAPLSLMAAPEVEEVIRLCNPEDRESTAALFRVRRQRLHPADGHPGVEVRRRPAAGGR